MPLKILETKPEDHFKNLEFAAFWFEGYLRDQVYGYWAVEIIGKFASCHLEVEKFSHSIMRAMQIDFAYIKGVCKGYNCNRIMVSNQDIENEEKWTKLITRFGFPEPRKTLISIVEI